MPTRSVGGVHAGPEARRDGIDAARGWTSPAMPPSVSARRSPFRSHGQ